MNAKKIVIWAAIIFIAYYAFTSPAGLGHFVHSALNLLKQAGASIATFLHST